MGHDVVFSTLENQSLPKGYISPHIYQETSRAMAAGIYFEHLGIIKRGQSVFERYILLEYHVKAKEL